MTPLRRIGLVSQSLVYIAGGVNHFWHSSFYVGIMPRHYSHPLGWVQFTGAAEILGGLGLLPPQTRRAAAWGIVAMLTVYYDVHIDMLRHANGRYSMIPKSLLVARLPLQLLLMAWAWEYTRQKHGPQRIR